MRSRASLRQQFSDVISDCVAEDRSITKINDSVGIRRYHSNRALFFLNVLV